MIDVSIYYYLIKYRANQKPLLSFHVTSNELKEVIYLTLADRADCLDQWSFNSWYQLCSPVLQMVAVVHWLNWLIFAVGWSCSSSFVKHLVVYTIDLRDRIHLLHKPHPSCCNTKTSPYPTKVDRGSVISRRYWACSSW